MTTPSPRQRALALRAWHAWQQKSVVEVKCYMQQPFLVGGMMQRLGTVYFRPRVEHAGWIGAQHLEDIKITRVH